MKSPRLLNGIGASGALAGKFVLSVATGGAHCVALCSDGSLAAWGDNSFGQLGTGSTTASAVPVAVNMTGVLAGKKVVAVSAGTVHSLALCSDGTVYSWGHSNGGRLGNGGSASGSAPASNPVAVDMTGVLAGKKVVSIAAGSWHNLVLCSDGTLVTWGSNSTGGQLGNNYSPFGSSVPLLVTDPNSVLAGKTPATISTGTYHNLVLCTDGTLVAWGFNENVGAVGDGSNLNRSVPVRVSTAGVLAGKTVISAKAGGHSSMALCSDGTLATWGWNNVGQQGINGGASALLTPVALNTFGVLAGRTVVDFSLTTYNGMAACSDGSLATWGLNASGQLGTGSLALDSTPVPVAAASASLAPGERYARPMSSGYASYAFAQGGGGYVLDASSLSTISLGSATYSVNQGEPALVVIVQRTGNAAAASVTFSTSDGEDSVEPPFAAALAGTDYEPVNTTVTFTQGEMAKVVLVNLPSGTDALPPNKHFMVTLSGPSSGAVLGSTLSAEIRLLAPITTNADLSSLELSSWPPVFASVILNPFFASGTNSYTASVANSVSAITVTPTTVQARVLVQLRVNGGPYASVTSGNASFPLALNVGNNTVELMVTASDGTTNTYTVTVARQTAFESWATDHGLPTDKNADGGENLLRFGFGMDAGGASAPLVVDDTGLLVSPGMPTVHRIKTDSSFSFHAIFTRPKNWASLGLTYTAQFSGDLINWVSSTAIPATIASDADNEAVTTPYPFVVNGKKARFFRLVIDTVP